MKLLRLPETLNKTGLSRTRLYEAVRSGVFPRPVKLGANARAVGWLAHEVDEWIADRVAERAE